VEPIGQCSVGGEPIRDPRQKAVRLFTAAGNPNAMSVQNATRSSLAVGRHSRITVAIERGRPPGLPLIPF
jgi:hypothetical protein